MSRKTPHLATIAAVASILVVAVSTAGSAIAPLAPNGVAVSSTTASSISTTWAAPSGNVLRYRVLVNGSVVGSTTSTQYTFAGLACGQTYTIGIASLDSKEAVSAPVTTTATTDACTGKTPPPPPSPPSNGEGSGSNPTPPPTPTPAPGPAPEGGAPAPAGKTKATKAKTSSTTVTASATANASSTSSSFYSFFGAFNSSWSPFQQPFCHNGQNPVDNAHVHFGNYSYDTQNVGQGTSSLRLDLPAWSGGRTRCQLNTPRTVNAGSDDYYGLMAYFPAGFNPAAGFNGVQIAELNYQGIGDGTANLALNAQSDHLTLTLATGQVLSAMPYSQYRSNADSPGKPNLPALYAIPRPMQLGVWHELILHVHWATNSTGQVDIWHRVKGQSAWTQTVSFSGYPTLKYNPGGSLPNGTNDILQAYRLASTAPVSVWLDAFSRSNSFASAAANLP